MSRTQLTGLAIQDGSLQRADMDITTPGQAMITKVIAGSTMKITSKTGADDGTGDVTLDVSDAIKTHVNSDHAPADAQKNSYITKAEIEAKLIGEITSHTHPGGSGGSGSRNIDGGSPESIYTASQVINGGNP